MAGKHEPPNRSSFYRHLATSTLKALILVAAAVLGVVGLSRAFPDAQENLAPQPSESQSASPTSPPRSTTSPSPSRKPRVKGISIQVLNGSSTTGLAAATSETLQTAGYDVKTPGNSDAVETTIIYYRKANRIDAEFMKERYFSTAQLKPATADVPAEVMIQVVLGADYAASAGTPSPSST